MSKYQMAAAYESIRDIDTDDLLSAVKIASNYEADLYVDGKLIMSPLGLEREDNTQRLEQYGITTYITNHRYNYRYTDESKNTTVHYAEFCRYWWDNEPCVDVRIHDYKAESNAQRFDTIDDIITATRHLIEDRPFVSDLNMQNHIPAEHVTMENVRVNMSIYDDNGITKLM